MPVEELIDQFDAVNDAGERFTIMKYQQIDALRTLNPPGTTHQRSKPYHLLADRRNVNRIDDQTFLIVETEEIIRKV
jgi:hypothetical protein